ncbi:HNH endonuclease [Variovorax paradoxus]|uniref:HNH endonuclease n=1 Tax=Variovorax paradoxus TaxID=34073 RepID=UPI003ED0680B
MSWIDLALLDNEADLRQAIENLDEQGRTTVLAELVRLLKLGKGEAEQTLIRLLLERARPFSIPGPLWGRSPDSSDDMKRPTERHFKDLGITSSPERLRAVQKMYLQFSSERVKERRVTLADLQKQDFRCAHCGLAFCNEELTNKGFPSPHGVRRRDKADPLKPQWARADLRVPTLDHRWPISLYGSNDEGNLYVLCRGCNDGKSACIGREQLPSFIGLPQRITLLGQYPISNELLYAQIAREPKCWKTGASAKEIELTVEIVDSYKPAFLDNLRTVESPGV